jgi:hypothetical protein
MADGWLSVLDADDRATFISEMRTALDRAEARGDLRPAEGCIRDWQVTCRALADPVRREVLTGTPGEDDFTEAGRPHA